MNDGIKWLLPQVILLFLKKNIYPIPVTGISCKGNKLVTSGLICSDKNYCIGIILRALKITYSNPWAKIGFSLQPQLLIIFD